MLLINDEHVDFNDANFFLTSLLYLATEISPAPFVWEPRWPHFEIPTAQNPVQNEVQREKCGAELVWSGSYVEDFTAKGDSQAWY